MTFDDLLSPISVERFLSRYWGKAALHVPGHASKFEHIFSFERFQEVLARGWPRGTVARAVFDGKGGTERDPQLMLANGEEARAAYRAGATVCIDRLETVVPELDVLCRSAKGALGYPGDVGVHAYWSPDRAGFRPHFDARIATTVQLHGRKKWRYGQVPIVEWPRDNAVIVGDEVQYGRASGERASWETPVRPDVLADWEEVTLSPGDVFCVPPGIVHSAEADESSFAINLHFNPVDTGVYIGRLLTHAFGDRPEWRNVPPLFAHGVVRDDLPGDGTLALAARLHEAIALFTRWVGDLESLHVHAVTELLVEGRLPRPSERSGRPAIDESTEIVIADGVYACSIGESDRVVIVFSGHRVEATGSTAAVLCSVLQRQRVRPDDLEVPGVERGALLEILRQLEGAGIVQTR